MPEPDKNGAQPKPEHLVHGNFDLLTTASGSIELRFFSSQANKTVGSINAWGMSLQALEVCLMQAYKQIRQQRTGIVEP